MYPLTLTLSLQGRGERADIGHALSRQGRGESADIGRALSRQGRGEGRATQLAAGNNPD